MKRFSLLGAIALTLLLWGSAAVATRIALTAYSPTQIAASRAIIVTATLLAYAALRRIPRPRREDWPTIALAGALVVTIYNLAFNAGQQTITAGSASLLLNTIPVWTTILALTFLGERCSWQGLLGIAISFAGTAIVALGEGQQMQVNWGAGLVVVAAIAQAVYFVIAKPCLKQYPPIEFTIYTLVAGSILLLPFAGGLTEAVRSASTGATLAIVYLAIGPAAIAYFSWSYVLSRIPASQAANLLYVVPLLTLVMAWIVLREVPSPIALVGGGLTIVGVAIGRRVQ
ncbi:MAG: DMT family transporter [Geitlerinemataceae cyanobacterium]